MRAFRVVRLLDVEVHIHPTFLLIFAWAFLKWGIGPGGGPVALALGLLFVLLIVLSVVVHEFGHVLMAREYGVRVLDVTLWPFGGVARIEQTPNQVGVLSRGGEGDRELVFGREARAR